jgi:hypothetical protein
MLRASYRQVLLQTPPVFRDQTIGLLKIGQPSSTEIYTRLCAERDFALAMHLAAADETAKSELQAEFDELRTVANSGEPSVERAVAAIRFDKACQRLAVVAAKASAKALTDAAPTPEPAKTNGSTSPLPEPAPSTPPTAGKPPEPLDPLRKADRVAIERNAANTRAINPIGWDLDVFVCGEQADGGIAAELSAAADARRPFAGEPIGRVTLRRLSRGSGLAALANNRNVVVGDANEISFAKRLADALSRSTAGRTVSPVVATGAETRWYLSVVLCAFPDAPSARAPN